MNPLQHPLAGVLVGQERLHLRKTQREMSERVGVAEGESNPLPRHDEALIKADTFISVIVRGFMRRPEAGR